MPGENLAGSPGAATRRWPVGGAVVNDDDLITITEAAVPGSPGRADTFLESVARVARWDDDRLGNMRRGQSRRRRCWPCG